MVNNKFDELFPEGSKIRLEAIKLLKEKKIGAFCRACGTFETDCATPFGYSTKGELMCQGCIEKWDEKEGEEIKTPTIDRYIKKEDNPIEIHNRIKREEQKNGRRT